MTFDVDFRIENSSMNCGIHHEESQRGEMRTAVVVIQWLLPESVSRHRYFAHFIFYPSLIYNILMEKFTNRKW